MLTNPFHNITFFTSFGFIFMSVIAWYRGFNWCALLDFCLFLTSVNYWRNPIKTNWRRYFDIFIVWVVILTHFPYTPWEEELILLSVLIVLLYGYNKVIGGNKFYKILRHAMMHILVIYYYTIIYEKLESLE